MALGTADRQAEPHDPRGVDTILGLLDTKLVGLGAAFRVDKRVSMKTRSNELLDGRLGQEVARSPKPQAKRAKRSEPLCFFGPVVVKGPQDCEGLSPRADSSAPRRGSHVA